MVVFTQMLVTINFALKIGKVSLFVICLQICFTFFLSSWKWQPPAWSYMKHEA